MPALPQAVPFGICTRSLGRSSGGHYILDILEECARSGLWTVEVAFECLEGYAKTLKNFPDLQSAIRAVAHLTKQKAIELGLALTVLDAFENYEGLLDRSKHEDKIEDFKFWVEICVILGVETIQIPATFEEANITSGDEKLIINDLREVADIGLSVIPPIKIAYEPLGWSTHVKTWEYALELIKKVDRVNIGLCLDTFHIASLLSHSPETSTGLREGGEESLKQSLKRLSMLDAADIFVYQVSDGTRFDPPIPQSKHTEPHLDPLFAWSMHGRPFPGEGYFPVTEISKAIFSTGYRGPTIYETFEDDSADSRKTLLAERANRAIGSWVKLSKELGLAPFHPPTPPSQNKLGTCTVNIGHYEHFSLEDKLYACASAGHQAIDLYEDDFLHYMSLIPGANTKDLWEANPIHLAAAKKLGDLCASLGMEIICFQPLIDVEGLIEENDRQAAVKRVKAYFPYMRALRTNVTYITTNRSYDFTKHTGDVKVIAADLASFADLAAEYSRVDGGPMLKIGYEHLSWGSYINTFDKTWEAITLANRPNLGFVFDTFNFLAVEYADPYNPQGHGRIHAKPEESLEVVQQRLSKLVKLIPGDKIYVVQVADAKLVDPRSLNTPTSASQPWTPQHEPKHRQWSTSHRLFPNEGALGGYMPVADCIAAILATGYKGALTLEIFNDSIHVNEPDVVPTHAKRAYAGIESCLADAKRLKPFW